MPDYQYMVQCFKNFKQEVRRIDEVIESDNENIVLDGWRKYRHKIRASKKAFMRLVKAYKDLYWLYTKTLDEYKTIDKELKRCYADLTKFQETKSKQWEYGYFSEEEEKKVRLEVRHKQAGLAAKKKKVDKMEQEYLIKQDELEIAIRDTNLARNSYYRLTEAEIKLFEKERPKILAGIEKYGSISLALKNDKSITMRASSIMHYADKHPQFKEDIEVAKRVFKDNIDSIMIDRAINGTVNPIFQKGEYIGDYAIKDNKLLVEVAKAKMPETYNPRVYAAANPQGPAGTTINIVSFDGVDETKHGYSKNIGVVQSVDESGRVERITQAKKMIDFYRKKSGAKIMENGLPDIPADAILEAEVVTQKSEVKDESV